MTAHEAHPTPEAAWHISSYSVNGGGQCVEAGPLLDGSPRRAVRDSTDRAGGTLVVAKCAWSAFLTHLTCTRISEV